MCGYYEYCKLDADGKPTWGKLEELGLGAIAVRLDV